MFVTFFFSPACHQRSRAQYLRQGRGQSCSRVRDRSVSLRDLLLGVSQR